MEQDIVNDIIKWLKKQPNCWWLKVHGHSMQRKGVPDILVCKDGTFYAIEVKYKNNKPSDIQKWELAKLKNSGAITDVVNNLTKFIDICSPKS